MEPGRIQITFDCADPASLGVFWAAALGYPRPDVEGWHRFLREHGRSEEDLNATFALDDPAGARPRLFFQRVPEPKVAKNRVHLDLAAPATSDNDRRGDIDAFVERLRGMGAFELRSVEDDGGYFVVMTDPEGNEFCVCAPAPRQTRAPGIPQAPQPDALFSFHPISAYPATG
jgi:hypothetical protein